MFEAFDRREEVVAERDEQVDVVEVAVAAEAVSQVVTRIDRCSEFAAAEERTRSAVVCGYFIKMGNKFGGRPSTVATHRPVAERQRRDTPNGTASPCQRQQEKDKKTWGDSRPYIHRLATAEEQRRLKSPAC